MVTASHIAIASPKREGGSLSVRPLSRLLHHSLARFLKRPLLGSFYRIPVRIDHVHFPEGA
jgi:hypothetical protein